MRETAPEKSHGWRRARDRAPALVTITRAIGSVLPVGPHRRCHFELARQEGEAVRSLGEIEELISGCEVLLVIGTSAQVYPAAGLPTAVKQRGGTVFEFNREQALGRGGYGGIGGISAITDWFFEGDVVETLPMLLDALSAERGG